MCICFCVYARHAGFVREVPKVSERDFRVVFQDQAMYVCLGVQKRAKLVKRVCFWSYDKFWKGHDGQIKEKRMQKHVFKVYFHT